MNDIEILRGERDALQWVINTANGLVATGSKRDREELKRLLGRFSDAPKGGSIVVEARELGA